MSCETRVGSRPNWTLRRAGSWSISRKGTGSRRSHLDVEQIAPGRAFQDELETTITRVKAAAIFCGHHGFGRWQVFELRALVTQCVERDIPVIPVLLSGVESIPAELVFLRQLHAVRLAGPHDAQALAQLQWGITGERGPPEDDASEDRAAQGPPPPGRGRG